MTPTRRAALTLPLALAACGRNTPPVAVPLREANDHFVAPVGFLRHEGLALIDNGAPLTSLDRGFADRAGLPRAAAGGGLAPLDMMLAEAPVRIQPDLEDMTEAAVATDAPVVAIAGMEIFKSYVVGFAPAEGHMTLHRRGAFRPQEDHRLIRLDRGEPPHPGVEVEIEGEPPLRAFLDLGCSSALLVSPALANRLGLDRDRQTSTRQAILSSADGLGLAVATLTSIRRLSFAGQLFEDVPIDILPEGARPFAGIDAVVGVPLLRRFDFVLDLPSRLHIRPNARLAGPFERRMTGLQVKPEGQSLLIRHVAPGSPAAAAGFKAGELIAAINGAPPLMQTLRKAKAGEVLMIALAGGGARRIVGDRYY